MNNLVIGNTSQLSYYFPEDYEKISSRNINLSDYENKFYDRIYFCFAEQRTFLHKSDEFISVNFNYTSELIDFFHKNCNKLIIYSTSELWNAYNGGISIDDSFNYIYSDYIYSKEMMSNSIKTKYNNVIILYSFNFNSVYRKDGFLFHKIFDSIINQKKIEIGNTYFYRDLIHPKFVVEQSIKSESDAIIGSGRLVFINDFIKELYKYFNMDYNYYVTENNDGIEKKNIFYLDSKVSLYNNLFNDTINDIIKIKYKK